MKSLWIINRALCYIPAIPIVCWILILLVGMVNFGTIPIYGRDPDPASLSINWLNVIAILPFVASFLTIPITIILTLILFVTKKNEFTDKDVIAICIFVISILAFFISRLFFHETFEWIMD